MAAKAVESRLRRREAEKVRSQFLSLRRVLITNVCRIVPALIVRPANPAPRIGLDGGTQEWYTQSNLAWRKSLIYKGPEEKGSSPPSPPLIIP